MISSLGTRRLSKATRSTRGAELMPHRRSDDVRARAANELQQNVRICCRGVRKGVSHANPPGSFAQMLASSRGLNGDAFGRLYTDVSGRLFILSNSPDLNEKMGAVQAVGALDCTWLLGIGG